LVMMCGGWYKPVPLMTTFFVMANLVCAQKAGHRTV
jgi:hypothetical protein